MFFSYYDMLPCHNWTKKDGTRLVKILKGVIPKKKQKIRTFEDLVKWLEEQYK
jgi:hypothetical protein